MTTSRGILYVATGEDYIDQMLTSAKSANDLMPELPIAVFTDKPDYKPLTEASFIDTIKTINNPLHHFGDKIKPLLETPFDETLFLDTDTIVVNPCLEIFAPLDKYDIAATINGYRSDFSFEDLPMSQPSYNTGVFVFKKSSRMNKFLESWLEKYGEYSKKELNDQPAFRYCVAHSDDIFLHTLPGEYNFYSYFPSQVGGFSKIKIIHGHGLDVFAKNMGKVLDRSSKGPAIYGKIEFRLILHWYYVKVVKVLRRWLGFSRR